MPKKWRELLITPQTSIIDAMKVIDQTAMQVALVSDESLRLLGTVTDGDIRRAILKGLSLQQPVAEIMAANPTVVRVDDSREKVLALMKRKVLRHIPVLDNNDRLVGLETLNELIQSPCRDNIVVLMAGGVGSRLRPVTNDCPKPLIKVGNKPILETILENLIGYGFHRFFLSVNYKADMIKAHFGSGSNWGVDIRYLEEEFALGTAGPLGVLDETPEAPVLVMNGDILTRVNFQQLLEFHHEHRSRATMCVREYDFQVPYGVISLDNHRLTDIKEKPVHRFFVNAGIYALDPEVVAMIPKGAYYDMPELFKQVMAQGHETAAFPVREYWLDIGRLDDLERAKLEYAEVFA